MALAARAMLRLARAFADGHFSFQERVVLVAAGTMMIVRMGAHATPTGIGKCKYLDCVYGDYPTKDSIKLLSWNHEQSLHKSFCWDFLSIDRGGCVREKWHL